MIQDIAPNVFHNEFHDRQPQAHEHVLVFDGGQALVGYDQDGRLIFPTVDDFRDRPPQKGPFQPFLITRRDYQGLGL